MTKRDWKIAAGTATIIGIAISVMEAVYAPTYIVDAGSFSMPDWITWTRLAMTSLAPVVYIVIDYFDGKSGENLGKE